ncbi:glycerol kinase GlpK [Furfurilactobacillus milii]|uniref:Glycerol kinase n=1 Tax=Furfurilactobacillus milii TaxID=2888272 RepID=A0A6N9I1M3_9LACO|nr:glycerol kinase GlpK [Furfurilactobacillus milii]MYV16749.1 glycerol kinase GlpK [Furfurilactobacillus milii]
MNDEQYMMAIDQGTTSSRAMIFNHQGQIVGKAQKEFPQYFPQPGWVEHDPEEIWSSVQSVMADALIQAHLAPYKIRGIGITNQRETTIIWDRKTGKPVYHAIVWQSKQTTSITEQWQQAGLTETIRQKTGLVVDAYFSASKIKWLLDNVPGCRERAEAGDLLFGTIDTWLLWKLTGGKVHATDYTNASRTMLFNIHDLKWDADLLKAFDIPAELLPEVRSSSEIYGYTANYTMSGVSVPICGIAGDQQAALFGQTAFDKGNVKNTYGTGAFIVMNIGQQPTLSTKGLLTTIAYGLNGEVTYALEGSIFVAGSAVQWLRDGMKLVQDAGDSEAMAMAADPDDHIYVVPAFTGLGAPYWDQELRGAVFGLTRGTTREQFVRATLQAIAYQTRDVVDTMAGDTGLKIDTLHVDGGASKNDYLMQFQADILNTTIKRAKINETTALGAAFLAGLAIGFWEDQEELRRLYMTGDQFEPQMAEGKRNQLYHGWQVAIKAAQAFEQ